jgi:hypothetical protein
MKPFNITPSLLDISGSYPELCKVKTLFEDTDPINNLTFIRMWMAEGIPQVFQQCPAIYQMSRQWLSDRLQVHPYQISIVGSARLGYSFNPQNLGRCFNEKSDLDFVIISDSLFKRCSEASKQFVEDFKAGRITPTRAPDKLCWPQDVEYIIRNTPKGFINHGKVPNLSRYEATRYVEDEFSKLTSHLKATTHCPVFTRASFRIYRDYDAFYRRASLNLEAALL